MPGTATGAVARKPSTREPVMTRRVVTYAMTSARIVPTVAVAVPKITVFFSASWVDDNSVNTNTMLCSVNVAGVISVVAFGENAALSNAKYGRNTGLSSTTRQNTSAAQRQPFISTRRGAPYLPPTTE